MTCQEISRIWCIQVTQHNEAYVYHWKVCIASVQAYSPHKLHLLLKCVFWNAHGGTQNLMEWCFPWLKQHTPASPACARKNKFRKLCILPYRANTLPGFWTVVTPVSSMFHMFADLNRCRIMTPLGLLKWEIIHVNFLMLLLQARLGYGSILGWVLIK